MCKVPETLETSPLSPFKGAATLSGSPAKPGHTQMGSERRRSISQESVDFGDGSGSDEEDTETEGSDLMVNLRPQDALVDADEANANIPADQTEVVTLVIDDTVPPQPDAEGVPHEAVPSGPWSDKSVLALSSQSVRTFESTVFYPCLCQHPSEHVLV